MSALEQKVDDLEKKLRLFEKSAVADHQEKIQTAERISQLETSLAKTDKLEESGSSEKTEMGGTSGNICSSLWGGPIMPSDDQVLW